MRTLYALAFAFSLQAQGNSTALDLFIHKSNPKTPSLEISQYELNHTKDSPLKNCDKSTNTLEKVEIHFDTIHKTFLIVCKRKDMANDLIKLYKRAYDKVWEFPAAISRSQANELLKSYKFKALKLDDVNYQTNPSLNTLIPVISASIIVNIKYIKKHAPSVAYIPTTDTLLRRFKHLELSGYFARVPDKNTLAILKLKQPFGHLEYLHVHRIHKDDLWNIKLLSTHGVKRLYSLRVPSFIESTELGTIDDFNKNLFSREENMAKYGRSVIVGPQHPKESFVDTDMSIDEILNSGYSYRLGDDYQVDCTRYLTDPFVFHRQ